MTILALPRGARHPHRDAAELQPETGSSSCRSTPPCRTPPIMRCRRSTARREIALKGRGGTDFRPGFAWLAEQGLQRPSCCLYFTDMECDSYPDPHGSHAISDRPVPACDWRRRLLPARGAAHRPGVPSTSPSHPNEIVPYGGRPLRRRRHTGMAAHWRPPPLPRRPRPRGRCPRERNRRRYAPLITRRSQP